jgi:hypothetical protein
MEDLLSQLTEVGDNIQYAIDSAREDDHRGYTFNITNAHIITAYIESELLRQMDYSKHVYDCDYRPKEMDSE